MKKKTKEECLGWYHFYPWRIPENGKVFCPVCGKYIKYKPKETIINFEEHYE